jgi:quinoprotein dehydrogenase-associated probable ABC transporter substrate-binding protein
MVALVTRPERRQVAGRGSVRGKTPPRVRRTIAGSAPRVLLRAGLCCAAAAGLFASERSLAQAIDNPDVSIELVDPKLLRVCADPHNMPFSTDGGQGFENKIAELLAHELGKSLTYTWYPQAPGFVRNTLAAHKCDLIMGMPQGDDLVQVTNPYYRTAYALVLKHGNGLDGVDTLEDARLKGKRLGVVAGTPPASYLAANGLMARAKPYPLVVDTRVDSSGAAMMRDLVNGDIDAGVLWGPLAGYFAQEASAPMTVVPLVKEGSGPRLAYRIAMGVRYADQEWKRLLNRMIAQDQPAITELLLSFGVPLLDDNDRPITRGSTAK